MESKLCSMMTLHLHTLLYFQSRTTRLQKIMHILQTVHANLMRNLHLLVHKRQVLSMDVKRLHQLPPKATLVRMSKTVVPHILNLQVSHI